MLVAATEQGYVAATYYMSVGLALDDMTSDDFLQIDMSLHGSFTNALGNGALVSLTIESGDGIIGVPSIGCNYYSGPMHRI